MLATRPACLEDIAVQPRYSSECKRSLALSMFSATVEIEEYKLDSKSKIRVSNKQIFSSSSLSASLNARCMLYDEVFLLCVFPKLDQSELYKLILEVHLFWLSDSKTRRICFHLSSKKCPFKVKLNRDKTGQKAI